MALVSPAHPEFRKFEMDQYLQLVRDGADRLPDGQVSNGSSMLDFTSSFLFLLTNRSLRHHGNLQQLLPAARAIDPGFSLAGEVWFDRSFPYIDVSYMRMGNIDMGSTVLKYTFPEWTATNFRHHSRRLQRENTRGCATDSYGT